MANWIPGTTTGTVMASDFNALSSPPFLNQTITQDYTNTHVMVGTGDDKLEPPAGPVPTSTAIGDAALNGYKPMEGIVVGLAQKMSQIGYDVSVDETGVYAANGFITFVHSQNNATVSFVYSQEVAGDWYFSQRPVRHKNPNNDGTANIAGSGLFPFADVSYKARLWIATDTTGTITCDTMSVILAKISDI